MAKINGTVPTPITTAINLFFNPIRKKGKELRADFRFSVTSYPFRVNWNISDTRSRQYKPKAFKFHAFYKKTGSFLSRGLSLVRD